MDSKEYFRGDILPNSKHFFDIFKDSSRGLGSYSYPFENYHENCEFADDKTLTPTSSRSGSPSEYEFSVCHGQKSENANSFDLNVEAKENKVFVNHENFNDCDEENLMNMEEAFFEIDISGANLGERKKTHRRTGSKTVSPNLMYKRRQAANLRERRRMQNLNDAFNKLRMVLPKEDNKQFSKFETLLLANRYIQELRRLLLSGCITSAQLPGRLS